MSKQTTKYVRVGLALPRDIDEPLDKLSKLQSMTKTAFITDILRDMIPVMHQTIEAIEQLKQGQKKLALDLMANLLADGSNDLNQAHIDFCGLKEKHGRG